MKQETGRTNRSLSENKVSIQLMLGGHSFSVESLTAEAMNAPVVEFVMLTPKTLLVPRELFINSSAGNYLQLQGMACSPTEAIVCSRADQPIVAVMAVDAACVAAIDARIGDRASYTSPMLAERVYVRPTVWLFRQDHLLYIKVYDPSLCFAEVMTIDNEDDMIYCIEQLASEFMLRNYVACAGGDVDKRYMKLLKRYFKEVVCE